MAEEAVLRAEDFDPNDAVPELFPGVLEEVYRQQWAVLPVRLVLGEEKQVGDWENLLINLCAASPPQFAKFYFAFNQYISHHRTELPSGFGDKYLHTLAPAYIVQCSCSACIKNAGY